MSTHRQFRPEIRAVPNSNGRQFWAMPLAYEVVDDYGTIWTEGVFDTSVRERMPTLLYGHDWASVTNILGRAIDYQDTREGPRALFELTEFDSHPHTRQVAAQINEGTMSDMSVGFDRRRWSGQPVQGHPATDGPLSSTDAELRGPTGARAMERILEAGWDETSLVVRGAVPGAKVLTGVRMAQVRGLTVTMDDVVELAKRKAAGKISDEEVLIALEMLARDDDPPPNPVEEELAAEDDGADEAVAEALDALESLET